MAALLLILPLDHRALLYIILFLVLILSGVGLPIPEEVTLLFGGYLAYLEFISLWPTVYVLTLGIVAADALGYFLGRSFGGRIYNKIGRLSYISLALEKARWYFDKHGEKVVFFSRPIFWIRIAVPILAGHFKMNFAKFLLYDIIASVPWVLFLVSLSYYLGSGLELITEVREIKHIMFGIIIALVAVVAVQLIRRYPTREMK